MIKTIYFTIIHTLLVLCIIIITLEAYGYQIIPPAKTKIIAVALDELEKDIQYQKANPIDTIAQAQEIFNKKGKK